MAHLDHRWRIFSRGGAFSKKWKKHDFEQILGEIYLKCVKFWEKLNWNNIFLYYFLNLILAAYFDINLVAHFSLKSGAFGSLVAHFAKIVALFGINLVAHFFPKKWRIWNQSCWQHWLLRPIGCKRIIFHYLNGGILCQLNLNQNNKLEGYLRMCDPGLTERLLLSTKSCQPHVTHSEISSCIHKWLPLKLSKCLKTYLPKKAHSFGDF